MSLRLLVASAIIICLMVSCAATEKAAMTQPPERQFASVIRIKPEVHPALASGPIPRGFGVNIHFTHGSARDLELMKASGIEMIRMDFTWTAIEREKGKYDFAACDQLLNDMDAMGIRCLMVIDYGNSLYEEASPSREETRAAYARMVEDAARRYRGRNVIWEVWNEPNLPRFWQPIQNVDDYMALVKALVPAIRRGDPDSCVVAPACSGIALGWLEECFKRGMLELVDGVSVHPYRGIFYTPARNFFPKGGESRRKLNEERLAPESTISEYRALNELMAKYKPDGRKVALLCGEWGYSTAWMSWEMQGAYMARSWLVNQYCGATVSIWYDWVDDGPDPKATEDNFGTINKGNPKPAYRAMHNLIAQLKGYRFVGRIPVGASRDYAMLYSDGAKAKLVVWTLDVPHRIKLDIGANVTGAIDYIGRRIAIKDATNPLLSEEPRYLELDAIPSVQGERLL
ncbi:MAG TPA: cellulase family glycosylhydrolase [Candidatus Brocadiia bacterium]|nr:cellulase family glycosylhydrolase [Candidatus Brocadiia bacterium]